MASHKKSYFDLLRALKGYCSDFGESSLRGKHVSFTVDISSFDFGSTERVVRLLFPLYSWFVINRGKSATVGGSQPSRPRAVRMAIPAGLRAYRLSATSRRRKASSATLMPRE